MKKDMLKLYEEKRNQLIAGAEMVSGKTRDWQVIQEFLNNRFNEDDLTDIQKEKLKRYSHIHSELLSNKYSEHDIIQQVMKLFGVKVTQAYEDLNCTKELFSKVLHINKRFELTMQLESAKKLLHKCEEMMDFKAAAAVQKNIVNLLRDLADDEESPADNFVGHTFEAVVDPRLIGAPRVDRKAVLDAINEKRTKKITKDVFQDIQDIDHEDVK